MAVGGQPVPSSYAPSGASLTPLAALGLAQGFSLEDLQSRLGAESVFGPAAAFGSAGAGGTGLLQEPPGLVQASIFFDFGKILE